MQNKKKIQNNPPLNSYGRRGKPPISLSSADYKAASLPKAGQAPPPQPPPKKEEKGLTIIIIFIIIITPTLPLRGKPPIS